jgi:DNA sulfur modification protein DndE
VTAPPRVTLSKATTTCLKQLSVKTGLSPNVVARFAMLASFEQDCDPADDAGAPDLTINQSSLFGDLEAFLMSSFSLRTGSVERGLVSRILVSHIARGASFLNVRVDTVADLVRLCQP